MLGTSYIRLLPQKHNSKYSVDIYVYIILIENFTSAANQKDYYKD